MAVSVLVAIRERFSGRILEWYVATQLLMWGIILPAPEQSLSIPNTEAFADFGLTETKLGLLMLILGVVRIGALIVNGAVPNVTPFVRVGGAYIGCGVWFFISMNLLSTGHVSVWIAAWPMAFVAEFVNIYRASKDARVGVHRARFLQRAHNGGRG